MATWAIRLREKNNFLEHGAEDRPGCRTPSNRRGWIRLRPGGGVIHIRLSRSLIHPHGDSWGWLTWPRGRVSRDPVGSGEVARVEQITGGTRGGDRHFPRALSEGCGRPLASWHAAVAERVQDTRRRSSFEGGRG